MEIHQFGKDARRRIAAAVKKIEKLRPAPQRGRGFPRAPSRMLLGQAAENIAAEASGQVTIYGGEPGAETDTSETIDAFNYFRYINSGDWVWCAHNGSGWYVVAKDSPSALVAYTDAAINKGASGTVSIYAGTPGSETDTTINVSAYNGFGNIGANKRVLIVPVDQYWHMASADC